MPLVTSLMLVPEPKSSQGHPPSPKDLGETVVKSSMYTASRHGIPNLTFLPKYGGVNCFGRLPGRSPIQFLTTYSHAYRQLDKWNWLDRLATHPANRLK